MVITFSLCAPCRIVMVPVSGFVSMIPPFHQTCSLCCMVYLLSGIRESVGACKCPLFHNVKIPFHNALVFRCYIVGVCTAESHRCVYVCTCLQTHSRP